MMIRMFDSHHKLRFFYSPGQVGVIILLIMVVILTVGLSVATRTTREAESTIQRENASRVFNAAEAGIEAALATIYTAEQNNQPITQSTGSILIDGGDTASSLLNTNYSITPESILNTHLSQGAPAELPLAGLNQVTIRWSQVACPNSPALLVTVYNQDTAITTRNYAVDGCANDRGNNMELASPDITAGTNLLWSYSITPQANDVKIRIVPLYNDTPIIASGQFDTVQYIVSAQAQAQTGGEEAKAIEVKRTIPTAPNFMDFALVSGGTIIK